MKHPCPQLFVQTFYTSSSLLSLFSPGGHSLKMKVLQVTLCLLDFSHRVLVNPPPRWLSTPSTLLDVEKWTSPWEYQGWERSWWQLVLTSRHQQWMSPSCPTLRPGRKGRSLRNFSPVSVSHRWIFWMVAFCLIWMFSCLSFYLFSWHLQVLEKVEVWESLCREGKGHRYRLYRIKMTFLPQQYYSVSPMGNIVFRYHGNFPCISVKQCVRIFTYIACAERLRNKSAVDFQLEIKELFDVDHSFLRHNITHMFLWWCAVCANC